MRDYEKRDSEDLDLTKTVLDALRSAVEGKPVEIPTSRICGYKAIAKAATAATKVSISVITAKRYAKQGRDLRLPVVVFPNRRAYVLPIDLVLWARSFTQARPSSARLPGAIVKRSKAPEVRGEA